MPLTITRMNIEDIKTYPNNAKIHTAEQIEQIKRSISEFGFNDPIAIWHGEIVEGHGRYIAAKELGFKTVDVIKLDDLTDQQRKAYALVHNKLTMNTGFDLDILEDELLTIETDMEVYGFDEITYDDDLNGNDESDTVAKGSLQERFLVPPFSVIYGNRGDWLARKRHWINFGIHSELGREGGLVYSFPDWMDRQSKMTRGEK